MMYIFFQDHTRNRKGNMRTTIHAYFFHVNGTKRVVNAESIKGKTTIDYKRCARTYKIRNSARKICTHWIENPLSHIPNTKHAHAIRFICGKRKSDVRAIIFPSNGSSGTPNWRLSPSVVRSPLFTQKNRKPGKSSTLDRIIDIINASLRKPKQLFDFSRTASSPNYEFAWPKRPVAIVVCIMI